MSHSSKQVAEGFYGTLDFAVMEAARITDEGHLVLSSGVGNNVEHLDHASHIIVEVNNWQSPDLEGIADVGVEVHHDAMVVITECGYADLRGLAPRHRAPKMRAIAHPDYRPLLEEYVARASAEGCAMHVPHDVATAFEFHTNLAETGPMRG